MKPISQQRATWLGRHVFPHEASLRHWLAKRSAGSVLDDDDIVQETYAILASRDDVSHIRDPRTYMFQVAKSVILQELRRSRVVTIDALADADALTVPCDLPDPEHAAGDRRELRRLETLVAALPARCRAAFILRKVHGLSQREAAAELGIAESTLEKHIVKAMLLLTDAIGRGGKRDVAPSSQRDPIDLPSTPSDRRVRP